MYGKILERILESYYKRCYCGQIAVANSAA